MKKRRGLIIKGLKKYRIEYPKLVILLITFVIAYMLIVNREMTLLKDILSRLGYFGTFLSGVFFAYGFTAAPATAILLILAKEQNIVIAGLLGGLGALFGDLLIFKFIRAGFSDEIDRISNERLFVVIHNAIPLWMRCFVLPVIAGFIIASPLPDEIGVALLASVKKISVRLFCLLSFVLNTAGIFVVLIIGRVI